MSNLAFKFLNQEQEVGFSPSIVVSVQGLTRFDMIYIYHHVQNGEKVQLIKTEIEGNFEVYFKTFKIGYIQLNKWNFSLNSIPNEAEIKYISKHKYLPINQMDVEISI